MGAICCRKCEVAPKNDSSSAHNWRKQSWEKPGNLMCLLEGTRNPGRVREMSKRIEGELKPRSFYLTEVGASPRKLRHLFSLKSIPWNLIKHKWDRVWVSNASAETHICHQYSHLKGIIRG